jgi:hypothetical protein
LMKEFKRIIFRRIRITFCKIDDNHRWLPKQLIYIYIYIYILVHIYLYISKMLVQNEFFRFQGPREDSRIDFFIGLQLG